MKNTLTVPRRHAFTLIELLIVIAIIGILASILFPVFARARENARRSSCQSNMKSLGLAMQQYTQDYDERLPIVSFYSGSNFSWDKSIQPYAGVKVDPNSSPTIFKCPSDAVQRVDLSNNPVAGGRSYAWPHVRTATADFNIANWSGGSGNFNYIGKALAAIPVPAETLQLVEMPFNQNLFAEPNGVAAACAGSPCQDLGNGVGRAQDATNVGQQLHFDGWNYLFVDGHVKWYRPEKTVDLNPNDVNIGTMALPRGMWSAREGD